PPPPPAPPPAQAPAPPVVVEDQAGKAAPAPAEAPPAEEPPAEVQKASLAGPAPGPGAPPRIQAGRSRRGGGAAEVELPEYKDREEKGPLVLVPGDEPKPEIFGLWAGGQGAQFRRERDHDLGNWKMETPGPGEVLFRRELNGVRIEKDLKAVP